MGIFKIPLSILREINKVMQSFWWGQKDNRTKIRWLNWKKLGKAKYASGLGFRDFENFNLALLVKQGWMIIQNPNSLAAQTMKAEYFPTSDFLSAKLRNNASYIWRSSMVARNLLEEGLLWKIGNGELVRIWQDK